MKSKKSQSQKKATMPKYNVQKDDKTYIKVGTGYWGVGKMLMINQRKTGVPTSEVNMLAIYNNIKGTYHVKDIFLKKGY